MCVCITKNENNDILCISCLIKDFEEIVVETTIVEDEIEVESED